MTTVSRNHYLCIVLNMFGFYLNLLIYIGIMGDSEFWLATCIKYWHAANAVNKINGGVLWHASEPTTAITNTILGPAGISLTALLLPIKWAGRSNPAITSTTSTVSKLTTVIPTSLSSRLQPMLQSTTKNNRQNQFLGGSNAAQATNFSLILDTKVGGCICSRAQSILKTWSHNNKIEFYSKQYQGR